MRSLSLRRLLSALLVVGMLAHAVAVVRHAAMMLGASPAVVSQSLVSQPVLDSALAALEADLKASICHPVVDRSGPLGNSPASPNGDCPICAGLACTFLMPAPQLASLAVPRELGEVSFPAFDQRETRHRFLRPASRGPPSIV